MQPPIQSPMRVEGQPADKFSLKAFLKFLTRSYQHDSLIDSEKGLTSKACVNSSGAYMAKRMHNKRQVSKKEISPALLAGLLAVMFVGAGWVVLHSTAGPLMRAGEKLSCGLCVPIVGNTGASIHKQVDAGGDEPPSFFFECFSPVVDLPALQGILVPQN